jgi:HEAT repeat protein
MELLMSSLVSYVLYAVGALWLLLMAAIAAGRYRHEQRANHLSALKHRLEQCAPEDGSALHAIVAKLTVPQLDAIIREGLPPALEIAVARTMLEHKPGLVQTAAAATNAHEHIAAVRVLASARAERAYDLLDAMLRSRSSVLAAAGVRILAKLDNRRSAELLVTALSDGPYSCSRIAAAIDMMTAPRADLLGPLFAAPHAEVRFWAARLAGRMQATQWAAQVREQATDVDPLVRRAAVEALGIIGDAADRSLLLGRLGDPVPFVRAHAARASVRFEDGDAAEALAGLLADRHWIVRAAARDALQRMGRVALPAVVQTLWHSDAFAANGAAEVLHKTGRAADAARQIVADPDGARRQVPIIARFLSVAGPHLRSAFLCQLSLREQHALTTHVEPLMGAS